MPDLGGDPGPIDTEPVVKEPPLAYVLFSLSIVFFAVAGFAGFLLLLLK